MQTFTEEWRLIFGNYYVSNFGRVKKGNRQLKTDKSSGYECVTLYKDGVPKKYLVHRLVASSFIPIIESMDQVNHIDGNKLNNMLINLEWTNRSLNQKHAYDIGLQKGYKKPTKMTSAYKKALCGSRWKGENRIYRAEGVDFKKPEDCAEYFSVNRQTVYNRANSKNFPLWSILVVKEVEDE